MFQHVFAESIPHLLHWDLAYLLVLETDQENRKQLGDWEIRVEAWKHLVGAFITGRLTVREELLPDNDRFLEFSAPFGIKGVEWLVYNNTERPIGVLSPTVLVRPLPDYGPVDDNKRRSSTDWPVNVFDSEDEAKRARFYVTEFIAQLRKFSADDNSYARRLARILDRELIFGKGEASEGRPYQMISTDVLMLKSFRWVPRTSTEIIGTIPIAIPSEPLENWIFIPTCKNSQCGHLLLWKRGDNIITVSDKNSPEIPLTCPSCETVTELSLESLHVWYRNDNEVVIWSPESRRLGSSHFVPPTPQIEGRKVIFEWRLGRPDEKTTKCIELHFPNAVPRVGEIDNIFFRRVLLSTSHQLTPYPVRSEWYDAVKDPEAVEFMVEQEGQVSYRHLQLKGIQKPLERLIFPIEKNEKWALGLYPNPEFVHSGWKWFRVFLEGKDGSNLKLNRTFESKAILPHLHETTSGLPFALSVSNDRESGATFYPKAPQRNLEGTASLAVGVDLGTSNSTIFSANIVGGEELAQDHISQYGIRPDLLHNNVLWITGARKDTRVTLGSFLFCGGENVEKGHDPYLFPSALWKWSQSYLVRWNSMKPTTESEPIYEFKWNKEDTAARRSYLREILLLALPSIIKEYRAYNIRHFNLHIGFAFPLAFDAGLRQTFKSDFAYVCKELGTLLSANVDWYAVNESQAVANSLGIGNPGTSYLIADMGGGTLDVSLLMWETTDKLITKQLGSLRFAGETFLKRITKCDTDRNVYSDEYQVLKDRLLDGEIIDDAKLSVTKKKKQSFFWMALEFLRVMALAHLTDEKSKTTKPVWIELVGNGWRLAPAFSTEARQRGFVAAFDDFYQGMIKCFGEQICAYDKRFHLRTEGWTKHLVAYGALDNAYGTRIKELDDVDHSELPIGRNLIIEWTTGASRKVEIQWNEIVGPAKPVSYDLSGFGPANKDFLFEGEPMIPERWKNILFDNLDDEIKHEVFKPDAETETIRKIFLRNIQKFGADHMIGKGVLQIMLEHHWKKIF